MRKTIIVFAPHPDDETLGCGGTIASRVCQGFHVKVAILTDGRNAFQECLGVNSNPTPRELAEIRRVEALNAIRILGVSDKNVHFMGFEDGKLKNFIDDACARVSKLLIDFQPDEVYFPYRNDSNPDHKATNRIVRKAVKDVSSSVAKYEYSIAMKYARIGPRLVALVNLLRNRLVQVDITRFFAQKKKAISQYKSQVEIICSAQTRPVLGRVDRFLKKKETFYHFR
jgi:LmbE family N-acetylglucosaminyl deacetylase